MSVATAGQAARFSSMRAAVDLAVAPGRDGPASASVDTRELLKETIRRNVMAWTKWTVLGDALEGQRPNSINHGG